MTTSFFPPGLPGTKTVREAVPRRVLLQTPDKTHLITGGIIVDGPNSRDLGNVGDFDVLRAGLIMGKLTANGRYAPSVICLITVAYADPALELTVGVDCAKEVQRRLLLLGALPQALKLTGPPAALGVVATQAVNVTAIDTGTGILTVDAIGADSIIGSLVQPADGSETMLGVIPDGTGIPVTNQDDTDVDVFSNLLRGGQVDADQIVPLDAVTDASLRTFIKITQLNSLGDFSYDEDYHPS